MAAGGHRYECVEAIGRKVRFDWRSVSLGMDMRGAPVAALGGNWGRIAHFEGARIPIGIARLVSKVANLQIRDVGMNQKRACLK